MQKLTFSQKIKANQMRTVALFNPRSRIGRQRIAIFGLALASIVLA